MRSGAVKIEEQKGPRSTGDASFNHLQILFGAPKLNWSNVFFGFYKDGKFDQDGVKVGDIFEKAFALLSDPEITDLYVAQNLFRGSRKDESLAWLNANYIDCDFYKMAEHQDKPVGQVVKEALDHLKELKIPSPTMTVRSGRGFQFIWTINPISITKEDQSARPRWKAVQTHLQKALARFGADTMALDTSRIFRVAGSINSKNGEVVEVDHVIEGRSRYCFDDLADQVLPLSREECRALKAQAKAKKTKAKRTKRKQNKGGLSISEIHQMRADEMIRLAEHRHPDGIPDGQRDLFIFHISACLAYRHGHRALYSKMIEIAGRLAPDLTDKEIRSMVSANLKRAKMAEAGERVEFNGRSVDPRYRYRSETLIRNLAVTPDEMDILGLVSLADDGRKAARRKEKTRVYMEEVRGDRAKREAKEKMKQERARLVQSLRLEGLSLRVVSAKTGLTINQVRTAAKVELTEPLQEPMKQPSEAQDNVLQLKTPDRPKSSPNRSKKRSGVIERLRSFRKTKAPRPAVAAVDDSVPADIPLLDHETAMPARRLALGEVPF
jgi:hypothetical protein